MKAIHNKEVLEAIINDVGNYKLKYNFESNSQHGLVEFINEEGW
ncbi:hypothetical protein FPKKA176_contig00075-0001 [Flavobacterium psychrophilum]|nr:hypothetical protein FPKKA176_contig00075-0001 [Flavobacterium psychrophilum]